MDVQELAPGLWRWTGWHEEWREQVGCVFVERDGAIVLIDPLVPPEDADRFHRALDRDVERAREVHILLTSPWHARSAYDLAARHGARILDPGTADVLVTALSQGLPLGIRPLPTANDEEVAYWLPEHRALVVGDVIVGGPQLCPESWLPDGVGHMELAASLRPLLELPIDQVLVSHGAPIRSAGRDALAAVLT